MRVQNHNPMVPKPRQVGLEPGHWVYLPYANYRHHGYHLQAPRVQSRMLIRQVWLESCTHHVFQCSRKIVNFGAAVNEFIGVLDPFSISLLMGRL